MQDDFCVIDDEPELVKIYIDYLSSLGSTRGFTSAAEALRAFDNGFRPKMTLVDLIMPEMSGMEFIEKCAVNKLAGRIVIASGIMIKDKLCKALSFGVKAYLEKPFTEEQLIAKVSELCGNKQTLA